MFNLVNRGELSGSAEHEIENLNSRLKRLWLTEHNEDGTHADIVAESVTVQTNVSVAGDIEVEGDGTFNGTVTADADGTPIVLAPDSVLGPGIALRNGSVAKWRIAALGGATRTLTLQDELSADTSALEIQATNIGATIDYTLMPHSASTRWFLGQNVSNQRWIEVNALDIKSNNGYYERGRSARIGEWTAYTPTWGAGVGANGSIGNGSFTGRYMQIGKTVWFEIRLILGSTSTVPADGASAWFFSIPTGTAAVMGAPNAWALDSGTAFYNGFALAATSTTINAYLGGASIAAAITNTNPFTWANGDQLAISGWYELV